MIVQTQTRLNHACKVNFHPMKIGYLNQLAIVPTQNDVRLALASRDAEMVDADQMGAIHCDITGSMMIHTGLELEEQQ